MSDSSNRKEELSDSEISEDSPEDHAAIYKGKYSAEKLMMMLDKERLEALEEEFNEHPDGIELHNFIWLMKCAMVVEPEEKADLVLGLYHLFQDIDINGDEHMEWSEFTQYIIDAVMGGQGKEKSDDKDITPSEIMEQALAHKSRRYHLSKVIDRNFHDNFMRHVHYHPSIDQVSVIEMGSDTVKFYSTQSEIKQSITPKYKSSAFILSMAFAEKDHLMALSCSDRRFYLFEKDSTSFRQVASNLTQHISLILWYFEVNNVWASACDDHVLRLWNMRTGEEVFAFKGHEQSILDAVEIRNPKSIATASLDGNVIVWDVNEHKSLGCLNGRHSRGVRSVDYTSEYGGNIISVGYERDIHIWSPEVTLSKCHSGKLEGHNSPVVSCKFFRNRPICISVDEKANVRVWDIRYQACLQIIPHDRGKIEVSKLITISKLDKFIVAGRRLVWYELAKDSINKDGYKDVNPLIVDFNTYFLQFVILTKNDLRMYDCTTGKLKKIFTDIQDARTESELSSMVLDFRNRIFFVGDNSGAIRAYNCANGGLLKKVNSEVKENIFDDESESGPESEESKQDDLNSEISALYFCNEDKILIASSWDSTIMVYDLMDLEEANLLRMMKGGHAGSDITCIAYSPYLSMIASGSSNGIVSVWDFQLGKLQAACFGHRREISALAFVDPYPVLATCSLDGIVCLWTMKSIGSKTPLKCIARLKNLTWSGTADESTSVTVAICLSFKTSGIARVNRKHYRRVRKNEPLGKSSQSFFKTKEGEKDLQASEDESAFEWVSDSEELPEEQEKGEVRERTYLYLADMKGFIKIWDLEEMFLKHKIKKLSSMERDKVNYNPRRKDIKNAESDIKYWRKTAENEELPAFANAEDEVLVKEWKAHNDNVNCLKPVLEPQALVSCSADKSVKVWSRTGDLWGCIDLTTPEPPKKWHFPFDWEGKRQQDIKKVMNVLAMIEDNPDMNLKYLPQASKQPGKKKIKVKLEQKVEKPVKTVEKIKVEKVYEVESLDDDDDEVLEKPQLILKKNYASVADLQRQLEELDDQRNAEYAETHFELNKKQSKSKFKLDPEPRKVEVNRLTHKSQNRLPKLGSVKTRQKIENPLNQTRNKSNLSQNKSIKIRETRRPIAAMGSTGLLKNFSSHQNSKIRIKKEVNVDVRYQPGESIRVMNRAISTHNFHSVINPYTEDLKTLKKKNEILKELVQKKMGSSQTSKQRL